MKIDIIVTLDDGTVLQFVPHERAGCCTGCHFDSAGDCTATDKIPPCTISTPGGAVFMDGRFVEVGTPRLIPLPRSPYREPDAVDVVGTLTISL